MEEEHDEDEDDEKIKEGDRSNDLEDGDRVMTYLLCNDIPYLTSECLCQ